eukprot:scaffold18540_cov22-Tisochrysis_lutea.AAC.1
MGVCCALVLQVWVDDCLNLGVSPKLLLDLIKSKDLLLNVFGTTGELAPHCEPCSDELLYPMYADSEIWGSNLHCASCFATMKRAFIATRAGAHRLSVGLSASPSKLLSRECACCLASIPCCLVAAGLMLLCCCLSL